MRFDDDDMFGDMSEGEEILSEEVDLENRFYDAKCEMEENLENAIEQFKQLVEDDEENKTEWGYKSTRKLVRHYAKNQDKEEFEKYFEKYLEYLPITSSSKIEKTAFAILGWVEQFGSEVVLETIEKFVVAMEGNNNLNRIIFKLNIRKAQSMFDQNRIEELKPFVANLISQCYLENGKEDPMRSHLLVDIYALEIQICLKENNIKQLQRIFASIDFSQRSISNNRVSAVVMFSSGQIKMLEAKYEEASGDFHSAFTSYNELGVDKKFDALKYYILCLMLHGSVHDVFQEDEIQSYKGTEQVEKMRALYRAYNDNDFKQFKEVFEQARDVFFNDEGSKQYEELFIEFAQRKTVMNIIKCFKRVKFSFLGKYLDLEENEVEMLLLKMIFDGQLKAKINQFERYLTISEEQSFTTRKYLSLIELSKQMLNAITV